MEKYLKMDIAFIIRQKIFELYTDPTNILRDFETDINFKVRLPSPKKLSQSDIFDLSKECANEISANLDKITLPLIIKNLSTEIVTKGREGIEVADYEDYFISVAKKIIQKMVIQRYSTYRKY